MLVFTIIFLVLVGFWWSASFGMAGLLALALISLIPQFTRFFAKSAVFGSPCGCCSGTGYTWL
jgi:hypothetical protein